MAYRAARWATVTTAVVLAGMAPASAGTHAAPAPYKVSASASSDIVLVGRAVTISGVVKPAAAGDRILLQWQGADGWRTVVRGTLDSGSRLSLTWTPPAAGTYNLRVHKRRGHHHAAGSSKTLWVTSTPSGVPVREIATRPQTSP
jgi:hypothetical protein